MRDQTFGKGEAFEMWPATKYPVHRAVADFHEALYSSSVALRHLHDFHDDDKIMQVAQQEKTAILEKFRSRNSNLNETCKMMLEDGLGKRLDIHIGRYLERNRSNSLRSEELLETNMDYLCKDFRTSVKMHRSVNPNMKTEEFEKLLENEKQRALASFRGLTTSLHLKFNAKFEDRIDGLQKELLTEHKNYLDEEEKLLKQLRVDILEMSKDLMIHAKSYTYTRNVAPKEERKMDLDEAVQDMYNRLLGPGNRLKESHPEIYDNLQGILGDAIKFLRELADRSTIQRKKQTLTKGNATFSGVIYWARNLEKKLKECFADGFVPDLVSARSPSLDLEEVKENSESPEGTLFLNRQGLGESQADSGSHDSTDGANLENDSVQKQPPETSEIMYDNKSVEVGAKRGRREDIEPLSPEDCIQFAERLDSRLQLLCSDNEMKEPPNQQNGSELEIVGNKPMPMETDADVILEGDSPVVTSKLKNYSVDFGTESDLDEDNEGPIGVKRRKTKKTPEKGFAEQEHVSAPTNVPKSLQIDQSLITDAISTVISVGPSGGGTRTTEDLESEQRPSNQLKGITSKRLNVPFKSGDFPLLRAIRNGKGAAGIKKMLNGGANVNIKNKVTGDHAAHEVITSIIEKKVITNEALAILKLLMDGGFSLLSDGDRNGITPLHYAMQIEDLDEELLTWFLENSADTNATLNENRDSVLLHAIAQGQGAKIIDKLLEAGANPRHVNMWKQTALHRALIFGNQEAFEVFIDKVDVNEVNMYNTTPLHHVFQHDDLDHEKCLRSLCEKGANFEIKNSLGYFPSVRWIGVDNIDIDKKMIFATLTKTKDVLPISRVVASATLRAIVRHMGKLQIYLPSSSQDPQNDFAGFIVFLIEEKGAKIPLLSETGWKEKNWVKLAKTIQTRDHVDKLTTISFEKVLVALLTCKAYKSFVEVCNYLEWFCRIL